MHANRKFLREAVFRDHRPLFPGSQYVQQRASFSSAPIGSSSSFAIFEDETEQNSLQQRDGTPAVESDYSFFSAASSLHSEHFVSAAPSLHSDAEGDNVQDNNPISLVQRGRNYKWYTVWALSLLFIPALYLLRGLYVGLDDATQDIPAGTNTTFQQHLINGVLQAVYGLVPLIFPIFSFVPPGLPTTQYEPHPVLQASQEEISKLLTSYDTLAANIITTLRREENPVVAAHGKGWRNATMAAKSNHYIADLTLSISDIHKLAEYLGKVWNMLDDLEYSVHTQPGPLYAERHIDQLADLISKLLNQWVDHYHGLDYNLHMIKINLDEAMRMEDAILPYLQQAAERKHKRSSEHAGNLHATAIELRASINHLVYLAGTGRTSISFFEDEMKKAAEVFDSIITTCHARTYGLLPFTPFRAHQKRQCLLESLRGSEYVVLDLHHIVVGVVRWREEQILHYQSLVAERDAKKKEAKDERRKKIEALQARSLLERLTDWANKAADELRSRVEDM